jgi:hypothetical protein
MLIICGCADDMSFVFTLECVSCQKEMLIEEEDSFLIPEFSFSDFEFNTRIENIENIKKKLQQSEAGLVKIIASGCYTNLRDPVTFFLENHIKLDKLKKDWLMSDSNDIKTVRDIIEHIRYRMVYLESSICKRKIDKEAIQIDIINTTIDFRKYLQIRHDYEAVIYK